MISKSISKSPYDLIGIGTGPFNLSIAALAENFPLRTAFLERNPTIGWHEGMRLGGAKIQNSSVRDLVSLADPTSRYSFVNFLHQNGRLEEYLVAGFGNTYRWEFEQYLEWVAAQLGNIHLNHTITKVEPYADGFKLSVNHTNDKNCSSTFETKNIAVGIGVQPNIPSFIQPLIGTKLGTKIFHNSNYNYCKNESMGRVAIVGAAQSGLEVAIDLLSSKNCLGSLTIFNKEPLIKQIEDSPFAEDQVFTTKGLERFVGLSSNIKLELVKQYRVTSDGASPGTLRELYQLMYTNKYAGDAEIEIRLFNQTEVTEVSVQKEEYSLCAQDSFSGKKTSFSFDTIILATGYVQRFPAHLFSEELLQKVSFVNETPVTDENYELEYTGEGRIFLVNGCKHSHGVVDPNLSLSAWRAMKILSTITGKEHINRMNQMCEAI